MRVERMAFNSSVLKIIGPIVAAFLIWRGLIFVFEFTPAPDFATLEESESQSQQEVCDWDNSYIETIP
jgi:hypothetical protein